MALRQMPSGRWQIDIVVNGQRIRETVGTKAEANQRIKAIQKDPQGSIKAPKQPKATLTLSKALSAVYEARWARSTTRDTYLSSARVLEGFLGSDTPLVEITADRIDAFIVHEQNRGMANSSINRRLNILRVVLRWAQERELIDKAPKVRKLKEMATRVCWFVPEEVKAIAATFRQLNLDDMADYVLVLYGTGARPGEALSLRATDVNLERNLVILTATKTSTRRPVPLTAAVRAILEPRVKAAGSGPLFTFEYSAFEYRWAQVRELLGKTEGEGWVPYSLRHTFGSLLAQAGTDLLTIQRLMGHSRPEQTLTYVKLADENLVSGIANLPQV